RRRHTRSTRDWSSDVCSSDLFLSVGSKAASFAMLIRIFLEGLPSMGHDWRLLFEALAIITMTVGNIAALTQSNVKRMLAYSSIRSEERRVGKGLRGQGGGEVA